MEKMEAGLARTDPKDLKILNFLIDEQKKSLEGLETELAEMPNEKYSNRLRERIALAKGELTALYAHRNRLELRYDPKYKIAEQLRSDIFSNIAIMRHPKDSYQVNDLIEKNQKKKDQLARLAESSNNPLIKNLKEEVDQFYIHRPPSSSPRAKSLPTFNHSQTGKIMAGLMREISVLNNVMNTGILIAEIATPNQMQRAVDDAKDGRRVFMGFIEFDERIAKTQTQKAFINNQIQLQRAELNISKSNRKLEKLETLQKEMNHLEAQLTQLQAKRAELTKRLDPTFAQAVAFQREVRKLSQKMVDDPVNAGFHLHNAQVKLSQLKGIKGNPEIDQMYKVAEKMITAAVSQVKNSDAELRLRRQILKGSVATIGYKMDKLLKNTAALLAKQMATCLYGAHSEGKLKAGIEMIASEIAKLQGLGLYDNVMQQPGINEIYVEFNRLFGVVQKVR